MAATAAEPEPIPPLPALFIVNAPVIVNAPARPRSVTDSYLLNIGEVLTQIVPPPVFAGENHDRNTPSDAAASDPGESR